MFVEANFQTETSGSFKYNFTDLGEAIFAT